MSETSFVHLHLHSEYSLLDGAIQFKPLMKRLQAMNVPAVALTDHGNLYGAIDFYSTAKKNGIKPIIGCEVYVAPGDMTERSAPSPSKAAYHLTLLSQNLEGYHNLIRLVSAAHLDGVYYKPRVDHACLAEHSQGIIALSGCLKGQINQALMEGDQAAAKQMVASHIDIFGKENFYLELHDHGLEQQQLCNRNLIELSKHFDLPLVAANDAHFLDRSDHEAHDAMICLSTAAMVDDLNRMRYLPELYVKSPEEMRALFSEVPQACDETLRIAERCNIELDFKANRYPAFQPPPDLSCREYLDQLCRQGLEERYGERATSDPSLTQRLDYELSVLERTGFLDYFLIVWDFIRFAKSKGIPVGPGRGSAAGSLVAFVLQITDIDPLRFGLIFERFLNPDRVSPPDIDIDFCQSRRGEVIEYVRQKYGERSVAQIVTFLTMGAKMVIRDVGRVLGMSYGDVDRVARMIPTELGTRLTSNETDGKTVPGAIDKNPDLRQAVDNEASTRRLWELAVRLEGLTRGTGVHAAGVVIADGNLSEIVPLSRGNEGEVITQFSMGPLTDLGLLKMDFLGLKTLTVLHEAERLIRLHQPEFQVDKVPLDDANTFVHLNRGETVGVFQLESGGMASLCRRFGVEHIDDIVALIALYRPGPMALIPDFIKRKRGETPIVYDHPLLEQVSAETYGIMIYQEQVQRAANVLAGYTLAEADLLRRAMGKKDREKMAQERQRFIAGCDKVNNIPETQANRIFDLLESFAGYGFNKSHSAAYALIAYRTAFLKANFPVEFMCGLLSNEISNTDKIAVFVEECRRMEIPILPPDLNRSSLTFMPEELEDGRKGIRYGLAAIKNVSTAAMEAAIAERHSQGNYQNLEDFCNRLGPQFASRKNLENLVKAGALDFQGQERPVLFSRVELAIASATSQARDRQSGQGSLFGDDFSFAAPAEEQTGELPQWTPKDLLLFEKELLGFYVTGHPLEDYREALEAAECHVIANLADLVEHCDPAQCVLGGSIASVERKYAKKDGKPFAVIILEDLTSTLEIGIFGRAYDRYMKLLEAEKVILVYGRVEKRDEGPRFVAERLEELSPHATTKRSNGQHASGRTPPPPKKKAPIILTLRPQLDNAESLTELAGMLSKFPGDTPVEMDIPHQTRGMSRIRLGEKFFVKPGLELHQSVAPWLDETED
ncbi:MAG: DNA polymerase III subunit alpha [Verrucomicrobiales bacterium]